MIDKVDSMSFGGAGCVVGGNDLCPEGDDVGGFFSGEAEGSLGIGSFGSGGMRGSQGLRGNGGDQGETKPERSLLKKSSAGRVPIGHLDLR